MGHKVRLERFDSRPPAVVRRLTARTGDVFRTPVRDSKQARPIDSEGSDERARDGDLSGLGQPPTHVFHREDRHPGGFGRNAAEDGTLGAFAAPGSAENEECLIRTGKGRAHGRDEE